MMMMLSAVTTALVALLYQPNLVTAAGGTCKTFTPSSSPLNPFTTLFDPPLTISNSVVCNGSQLGTGFPSDLQSSTHPCNSTQCAVWIDMNYAVELHSRMNLTSISNQTQDNLFQLIQDTDDRPWTDFNRTITRKIGISEGMCIDEGMAGRYILTPYYFCTNGTLSGCSGDDALPENTTVEACGIRLLSGGFGGPDGIISFLQGGAYGNRPAPPNATGPADSNSISGSGASSLRGADSVGLLTLGVLLGLLL